MTIQQIRYAIAIADAGSYSRAAEILYVAQPSLTNSIKELENELGIRIFYRGGKGVTLTPEGEDFIPYAIQVYNQYESLLDRFGGKGQVKKKFGVSAQHYSFATKAFVELVKKYDVSEYEFALRETRTKEVIEHVARQKSEIGILYLSDFNRAVMTRLFKSNNLEFVKLIECRAYVYLWKGHPLAAEKSINLDQLSKYPCLMFEQGEAGSFYFSEEILSTNDYPQIIWTSDRATNLNLMVGLNAFTLCSGIICEELNGSDYKAVPYKDDSNNPNSIMEIGYLKKEGAPLTVIAEEYVSEVKRYLGSK